MLFSLAEKKVNIYDLFIIVIEIIFNYLNDKMINFSFSLLEANFTLTKSFSFRKK